MTRILACAAIILCATSAFAAESIRRELEGAPDGRVVIDVTSGRIQIVGSDEPRILIEGTRTGDPGDFTVERDGKVTYIEDSDSGHKGGESNLVIHVPRESAVEAEIISGQITIRELTGVVEVATVAGDVDIECDCGRIQAEAVSGSVEVRNAGPMARGEFASVSGDVGIDTALAEGANLEVEAVSGNVKLSIRGEVNARVSVETGPGGDIKNGFSSERPDRERYSGSESIELRLGNGAGDIDISVVTGTVTLEKK